MSIAISKAMSVSGRLATVVLLGLGVTAAALASAPSQFAGPKVKVSFADLDIESIEGAKVLYARLQRASRKACDDRPLAEAGSIRRVTLTHECYREALSKAVDSIGSDALTAVHSG